MALTALLGKRLARSWAPGIAAALLLATTGDFFGFALTAHPDTLQVALLVLGLV